MALTVKNYDEIAKRGAQIDNAEFVILKCSECGSYALYDEEVSFIYMNPADLTKKTLYGLNIAKNVGCISCGKMDSFEEVKEEEYDAVLGSEWRFTLCNEE
jgi:predicted nucleic-acid-binding Zn-ribbon protein